jgi:hypothetical protein
VLPDAELTTEGVEMEPADRVERAVSHRGPRTAQRA